MGDSFPAPTGALVFGSNGLEGRLNSNFTHSPANITFSSAKKEGLFSSDFINPNRDKFQPTFSSAGEGK